MLVLSRQRDETILVGNDEFIGLELTKKEQDLLRKFESVTRRFPQDPEKITDADFKAFQLFISILTLDEFRTYTSIMRKLQEAVAENGPIEVTVVDIRGDKVRLGITARRKITVHRKEVKERIDREERAARQSDATVVASGLGLLAGVPEAEKPKTD
jgi:carbon storage regulator